MKKLFTIILSVLCLAAVTSCNDFLDMKPTNSLDTEASIESYADAQVAINGLMRQMLSGNLYGRNLLLYADAKGGDFTVVSNGRGYDALWSFDHSAISGNYSGFWTTGYRAIAQINGTLAGIEKIEESSSEDFSDLKGQLYTLRGMLYFDLVRIYGRDYAQNSSALGVSITTELDATNIPARSSVELCYQRALDDLKAGVTAGISKSKRVGFVNYWGNLAYQARIAMHKKEYPTALSLCKEIIEQSPYSLYSNANWAKSWASQNGSESIIEFAVYDEEADLGGRASLGAMIVKQGDAAAPNALGYFVASDGFLTLLSEDAYDVRWEVMDEDEIGNASSLFSPRKGACYKYVGGLDRKGDGKASCTAVNIKVVRLSEIYLIAAEAAFRGNDKATAASYLQEIRKRAPNLAAADESNITLDMILNEKSKELFGEGVRYWDMVRCYDTITYNDTVDGGNGENPHAGRETTIDLKTFYKCILPIDDDEITASGGIIEQNPGY